MNKAKLKKMCPIEKLTADEQSRFQQTPKGAQFAWGVLAGQHVTVAHAAQDWNVSARRIRALLASGRLLGAIQENGYWLVHFPYAFTFGTRGPSLKRQQRPPKRPRPVPKKPELKAV